MKKLITNSIVALLLAGSSLLNAQARQDNYLGLPGDNLNLFAVLNLFQESETLEGFERSLNHPEAMINNLDLNGDGYVDYILVMDYFTDNVHHIVLRVALNQDETQDVAVFVVERLRSGAVSVQLIGDQALYGPNYIIEPNYAETPNPAYRGRSARSRNNTVVQAVTYYDVATWPVIVYISRPVYRPWRSVWYWGYWPAYWSPWRAHYWHFYYGYHYQWNDHYHTHFRPWRHFRCGFYQNYYITQVRNYSPTVVVNINSGVYQPTYSRPETRREGEAFYGQRGSGSGRVPSGTQRGEANGRISTDSENRDAGNRSVNAPRNSNAGASSRGEGSGRGEGENIRRGENPINETRPGKTTTAPVRGDERREGNSPNVEREAPRQSRTAPAPANNSTRREGNTPNVEREAPRQSRPAPAPANNDNRREGNTPNVEREAPRQSSPAEAPARTAPAENNRTYQSPAPARNTEPRGNRREEAPQVSEPAQSRPANNTTTPNNRNQESRSESGRENNSGRENQ